MVISLSRKSPKNFFELLRRSRSPGHNCSSGRIRIVASERLSAVRSRIAVGRILAIAQGSVMNHQIPVINVVRADIALHEHCLKVSRMPMPCCTTSGWSNESLPNFWIITLAPATEIQGFTMNSRRLPSRSTITRSGVPLAAIARNTPTFI